MQHPQDRFVMHFVTLPVGMKFTVLGSSETRTITAKEKVGISCHPAHGCYWLDARGRQCHASWNEFGLVWK